MTASSHKEIRQPFRPRARVLRLLGDELIGGDRLAVFKLVKNAYDADANEVIVRIDLRGPNPKIVVADDGDGMPLDIIQNVWLVPGHEHRAKQRALLQRTKRHHRLPVGEKGLGRFAVHKLGDKIRLITRAAGEDECIVEIDWNDLTSQPFLDAALVGIRERKPEIFTGRKTGTLIEISDLRRKDWTRGEVRRLQRQIISISSPFEEPSGFRAGLEVPGHESWIADIPDVSEILARALWKFTFRLEKGVFDWNYEFRRVPGLKLEARKAAKKTDKLKLPLPAGADRGDRKVIADDSTTAGIGPVTGEFYVYDRDREVMRRLTDVQLLTDYLDENGGIRIYRDGIRVYNYGEPGDDWLGLDLRRVNAPTRGISRNIILGAVHLSLQESTALVEKTNREGFVETEATDRLKRIVLGALSTLESERQIDKERIRELTAAATDPELTKIQKPIQKLRGALDKKGLTKTFEPYVEKIEHDLRVPKILTKSFPEILTACR